MTKRFEYVRACRNLFAKMGLAWTPMHDGFVVHDYRVIPSGFRVQLPRQVGNDYTARLEQVMGWVDKVEREFAVRRVTQALTWKIDDDIPF